MEMPCQISRAPFRQRHRKRNNYNFIFLWMIRYEMFNFEPKLNKVWKKEQMLLNVLGTIQHIRLNVKKIR
jgi:hypothetical protein